MRARVGADAEEKATEKAVRKAAGDAAVAKLRVQADATLGKRPSDPYADDELEAMLLELNDLQRVRKESDEYYESLRDQITARLEEPKAFIDSSGNRMVARRITSESVIVDLPQLRKLVSDRVYDSVTERKINSTALKNAVAAGRISAQTYVKVAKLVPRAASVRFFAEADPGDAHVVDEE